MAYVRKRREHQRTPGLIGLGLDSDGHKRITKGENFALYGGSAATHEHMIETSIKINEKLRRRGKALQEISRQEFDDIAHEVGLRRHHPNSN